MPLDLRFLPCPRGGHLAAALGASVVLGTVASAPAAHAELAELAGTAGPFASVRAAMTAATEPIAAMEALAAAHPELVRIVRPIPGDDSFIVVEVGSGDAEARRSRPALLVVAGLDGRHTVGTAAAVRLAQSLADDPAPLADANVWIVPRVVEPGLATGRLPVPDDADHDGRVDEDGPSDLDGDGTARWMRLADPSPLSGLEATHVVDPEDDRIMRPATGDERPTHVMLPEGRDMDGDGRIAEDGPGGVAANADWPAHWPEFSDEVAAWPLSVPRTRTLADWVLATEQIVAVLVFGPGDSLAAVPTTRGGGPTGRVPEGLLDADESDHERVSRHFREATGITGGDRGSRAPGSFDAWAYAHLGLWSFATPLWDRPDRMGALARSTVVDAQAADEAGDEPAAKAGGRGNAKKPTDDEAWLAWIDAERGGRGFQPWTAVEHPDLGPVEVGGFAPGLRVDPPSDLIPAIAGAGAAFARDLIGMFPHLEISRAEIRPVSGDIHAVAVTVTNTGQLPTRPAIAARVQRLTPTLIRLSVDDAAILAGPPLTRIDRLDAGETTVLRWHIRTNRPGEVSVVVTDPMHGRMTATLSLGEED